MSLTELFNTFANNILPILLISGGAYLLGGLLDIDSRSIGRVSFYFFNPILVFSLLIHSQLPMDEILQTGLICVLVILASGLAALLIGWLLKFDRRTLISTLLTAMFANNGNFGIPLVAFAFGPQAMAHAGIYFVFSSLTTNTLGVVIASLGHLDLKQAILGVFKIPTLYAVLLAAALNLSHLPLPLPLDRTVTLAAGAGVPMMIVLLGLELRRARWLTNLPPLGVSVGVRLLLGPLLGFLLAGMFGLHGDARAASIIESSMPAAVANTNLANEYHLDPSLVAATVLLGTILSPLILTPLLVYLTH